MAEKRCHSKHCQENIQPAETGSKREQLSLSLKRPNSTPCKRFALVSAEEVEAAQKPIVPQNTQKSTEWAFHLFQTWLSKRNEHNATDQCPEDILVTDDHGLLCKWLCIFASEARKVDGSQYTPQSIAQTFTGLQRYISVRRNPQLFDLLTQRTQCLSLCTSCLTVCPWSARSRGWSIETTVRNHIQVWWR